MGLALGAAGIGGGVAGVDQLVFDRGGEEDFFGDARGGSSGEGAGEDQPEVAELLGDFAVLVHAIGSEGEEEGGAAARPHGGGVAHVGHDFVAFVGITPSAEEFGEVGADRDGPGAHAGRHALLLLATLGGDEVVGIEEGDDAAASEEVLVDGPLGFVGDAGRVDHEEDVDAVVDLGGGEFDGFDFVLALNGLVDGPGGLAAATKGHRVAGKLQGGHEADDFLFDGGHFGDPGAEAELDAVLVDEGRHEGGDPGDEGRFVEAGDGDAEVLIALGLEPGGGGGLFFIGGRFDDVLLNLDEVGLHFVVALQPAFHLAHHGAELRHEVVGRGDVELDRDVGVDPFEDALGALGEGVDLVLGEVEVRGAEAEEPIEGDEDPGDHKGADAGEEPGAVGAGRGGTTGRGRSAHFLRNEERVERGPRRFRRAWCG